MSEEFGVVQRLKRENETMVMQFRDNLKQSSKEKGNLQIMNRMKKFIGGTVVSKTFKDGSKFEGEVNVKGERDGEGIIFFSKGDIYMGGWKNDRFNGTGTYIFSTQERYTGDLVDGLRNGKGTFYYSNGNKYDGSWQKNEKNGKGFLYFSNGDLYEGNWVDGVFAGNGTERFFHGDVFEGTFSNGRRNGFGTYKFKCGTDYIGEWKDNKADGNAKYISKTQGQLLQRGHLRGLLQEWQDGRQRGLH
jgi:hypothetical protein